MDLRPIDEAATDDEREAVDAVLGPRTPELDRALRTRRDLLLPGLRALHARAGWVRKGGLGYLCERLHVPPAEGFGVASFYALLATEPRPRTVLHVCDDVACRLRGSSALCDALAAQHGAERTGVAHDAAWQRSPCLGQCDRAPAVLYQRAGSAPREVARGPVGLDEALSYLRGVEPEPTDAPCAPQPASERWLARRVDDAGARTLDGYRARGGYEALRRAHARGAAWVLRELTDARLLGRGGAGFPAGRKWAAVAQQPPGARYVVCNADESEPGTFKDRALLEGDPFAVLEGVTLAAFTVGAERAYIYVRGEYPLAAERLEAAVREATARGFLGDDVLGDGQRLEVDVRRGAGAYICGEETALLNSLEGKRGEPRPKPPFPVERGLFGQPTLVNNVETLCAAVAIVREGAEGFAARGTRESAGTRLFCVAGHVAAPGVYELGLGATLGALLERAGGVAAGAELGAVLLGGAAGTFVGPEALALPLTFEHTRAAGATLGSGAVVFFAKGQDMSEVLAGLTGFFRHESCGQCVPCREGVVRVDELVRRVRSRRPAGSWSDERARLRDLGVVLREASICGLGHTAASAVESAFARFALWPDAAGASHESTGASEGEGR